MKKRLILAAAIAASAMAFSANAATVTGVYNTAVDNSGVRVADGSVDAHWLANSGAAYVYNNPAYTPLAGSSFIAVAADGSHADAVNTFTLDFSIEGAFSSASLSGVLQADNFATVYLNGVQIGQDQQATVYSNFDATNPYSFSALTGLKQGANELKVVLTDTGGPSAMEISSLSVLTTGVPEPASWALMMTGLGLVGGAMRANRKTAVAAA
jgi:hypothetical protein